jgi:hypothetical protein
VRVNGTLVQDKMRRFTGECEHFSFNKCPIYTHDGASAKFTTNTQEMDNSADEICIKKISEINFDKFKSDDCTKSFSRVGGGGGGYNVT